MLQILESIKNIIEKFVVNITPLTAQADAGDTIISIASTRRYCVGDNIIVYNKPDAQTQATGEVFTVTDIIDSTSLELSAALIATYPVATSTTQKLTGYTGGVPRFLEAVYLGDPPVIPRFPAICIDAKTRSSEWMTIRSIKNSYSLDVIIYVDMADYESQYKTMLTWTKKIETGLFRSLYPLVGPYTIGTLAQDANADDTVVTLVDPLGEQCAIGWVFIESYDYLAPNMILGHLGNNVYKLVHPLGFDFSAGDKLVRPTRHVFNTLPANTRYGVLNKDGKMLKSAIISYNCQIEDIQSPTYIDPITF